MVEEIEHLGPELQFHRLMNREISMDREIPLSDAKSPQSIP